MRMYEAMVLCGRNLASLSMELATVNPASKATAQDGFFFHVHVCVYT